MWCVAESESGTGSREAPYRVEALVGGASGAGVGAAAPRERDIAREAAGRGVVGARRGPARVGGVVELTCLEVDAGRQVGVVVFPAVAVRGRQEDACRRGWAGHVGQVGQDTSSSATGPNGHGRPACP